MHLACSQWCCKDASLLGFYAVPIGKVVADILNDPSAFRLKVMPSKLTAAAKRPARPHFA
jgi:hypothetical protein